MTGQSQPLVSASAVRREGAERASCPALGLHWPRLHVFANRHETLVFRLCVGYSWICLRVTVCYLTHEPSMYGYLRLVGVPLRSCSSHHHHHHHLNSSSSLFPWVLFPFASLWSYFLETLIESFCSTRNRLSTLFEAVPRAHLRYLRSDTLYLLLLFVFCRFS